MTVLAPLLADLVPSCDFDPHGMAETHLPGVRIFRATEPVRREPLLYDSGIVIIGQGAKVGHVGGRRYHYDSDQYLVLTVPTPLECEILATESEPLLGVFVDLEPAGLYTLVRDVWADDPPEHVANPAIPAGVASVALDDELRRATERLLRCLREPVDSRVLGPSLVREVIYRVLLGAHGHALYGLTRHDGQYARVVRVLHKMHREYAEPLSVDELARHAAMSSSSFHRVFKHVTSDSPLRYLKKIRLNKARDLIMHEAERASVAAARVGYESASQFSREFKRFFGVTPTEARARNDHASAAG